jgi:hypothetical protein
LVKKGISSFLNPPSREGRERERERNTRATGQCASSSGSPAAAAAAAAAATGGRPVRSTCGARGGRKNKTGKRRTSAQARKKNTHVRFILFYFFSAFLGVFRRGEFENTGENFRPQCVSKAPTGEIFFRMELSYFFFFRLFLLRWLSASR